MEVSRIWNLEVDELDIISSYLKTGNTGYFQILKIGIHTYLLKERRMVLFYATPTLLNTKSSIFPLHSCFGKQVLLRMYRPFF